MSHVEIKKRQCCRVEFKGQGPSLCMYRLALSEMGTGVVGKGRERGGGSWFGWFERVVW